MRIGELAEKSGLSRDTIRFYERNGLITSTAGKSETNNYRDYHDENVLWLAFLTGARESGMSIADLRGIVEARNGSCNVELAKKIIRDKIKELNARQEQIVRAVAFLEETLEKM